MIDPKLAAECVHAMRASGVKSAIGSIESHVSYFLLLLF